MSVLLEGNVVQNTEMNGIWQFSKEHRSNLNFQYHWVSNLVPRDVIDYVSFRTTPPHGGRGRGRGRGRGGRGRGRISNTPISSTIEIANVDGTSIEIESSNPLDDSMEADMQSEPVSEVLSALEGAVPIPREHPLFGMWEGTFDVKSTHSVALDKIPESFFFHSYYGKGDNAAQTSDLLDLPPEPTVSQSVLKLPVLNHRVIVSSTLPAVTSDSTSDNVIIVNNNNIHSNSTATSSVPEPSSAATIQTNDDNSVPPVPPTTENLKVISKISESVALSIETPYPNDEVQFQSAEATGGSVSETPQGNIDPAMSLATAAVITDDVDSSFFIANQINHIVLYGFGKNMFGRFSIVGSFNLASGDFRCEKKYMLTKGVKKVKREQPQTMGGASAWPDHSQLGPGSDGQARDEDGDGLAPGKRKRVVMAADGSGFVYPDAPAYHPSSSSSLSSAAADHHVSHHQRGPKTSQHYHHKSSAQSLAQHQLETCEDEMAGDYKAAFLDDNTGEIYEGDWRHGRRHGRGICLYTDGNLYEGNWVNNKEQGHGVLMSGDRQFVIYSGEWLDGLMHGHGVHQFYNGDKYTGDCREGTRHGRGEYTFASGCRYVGDWRDNRRQGRGVFTWSCGSWYEGDWDNDCRSGRGVLVLKSGFRYDGGWAHNLMEGRGVCTFASGQEYQGSYKQGLREGRGSITFSEGAVYEGRFRDDRIDGQGTIHVTKTVPGLAADEKLIPIQIQADIRRIHMKAGFGDDSH